MTPVPGDTAPGGTAPGGTAPIGTAPIGTAPAATGGRSSAAVDDAMAALRDVLGEIGYSHIYTLVAGSQLFAPDHARALRVARSAGGVEGAVLELLGLGATVPVARLGAPTSRALELCARAGLARVADGLASTADWLVVPALGGYLLTGPPPTYAARRAVGANAYVGPDSLKLAGALPDPRGKRVLDVGTGCGIQGLLAARGASEAVCTDTEERSLALAACNRVLNATAHPVRIVRGDLYSPVAGERFDLVVSLPPYVPEVPAAAASRTVGGGPDGLAVLRPLLAGAYEHLLPGGEVVVRSQLLCDARGPLLASELDRLAPGLETTLTVTDWHPLQPYVLELATSFATYGARATSRELVDQYSTSLRALGATGVCTALVRARRPGGRPPREARPPVRLVGWTAPPDHTTIPRPAPGLRLVEAQSTHASAEGATDAALDGPDAALLRAIDGSRSVGDALVTAWGSPVGALPEDLVDQALIRLTRLAAAGLVELDPTPGP